MSAEYAADRLMDAVVEIGAQLVDVEPCEDMRSGGYFFDFTLRGRTYEVLVTETNGGTR